MSKIVSIQILRGVAATLVAGFHLQQASVAEGGETGLFRLFAGGEIGVDIFFVISGFIIYYVARSRPGMTRAAFLRARFWRIFPPYWAILTLYVLAALGLALVLGDLSKLPDLQGLIVSYLLLPLPDHIIVIAWTLSIELLFYGIFALAYFGGGPRTLLIAMAAWVIASQIYAHGLPQAPSWLGIALHTAVLEFLFGTLIAMAFLRAPARLQALRLPGLLLGMAGVTAVLVTGQLEAGGFGREIVAGIPAALLVIGVLGWRLDRRPVLETWGESSYTLYLLHILFYSVAGIVVERALGQNVYHAQGWMLLMLASVIALSYASTVWLERPYQRWHRRRSQAGMRTR